MSEIKKTSKTSVSKKQNKKNNQSKTKKTTAKNNVITKDNNKLLLSLIVILFYFAWPQIVNAIKSILAIGDANDFVFGIISNLALISILIYIYRKDLKNYVLNFKKNLKKSLLIIGLFSIISIILVPLVNSIVINVLNINEITANDNSLFASFEKSPLLIAFMTIIYYPIVEEIVFEKTLKDVIKSKWLFIILSSIFFWYYNIAYTASLTYVTIMSSFYYFVLGFIRALAYHKTDNLVVPICIKSIYNAFVTLIS